jgi:hypothetical protein
MSEQTKPVSKPDDQTTKAKPARTELSQEELDRVSGGFNPVDGKPFSPVDGNI